MEDFLQAYLLPLQWVTVGLSWNSDEAIYCTKVSPLHQCDVFWWEYISCREQGSATVAWPNVRAKSGVTGGGLSCRLAWRTVCLDQSEFGRATAATQRAEQGGMLRHKLKRQSLKAGCSGFFHSLTLSFTAELCMQLNSTTLTCPSGAGPVSVCPTAIQAWSNLLTKVWTTWEVSSMSKMLIVKKHSITPQFFRQDKGRT